MTAQDNKLMIQYGGKVNDMPSDGPQRHLLVAIIEAI